MAERYLGRIIDKFKRKKPVISPVTQKNDEILVSPVSNIAGYLQNADFPSPKNWNFQGMGAVFRSSERVTPDFYNQLKSTQPNGYLIGVGVGGIFALIDGFVQRPIGLVAVDINPQVVAAGKIMIDVLKRSENVGEFKSAFFDLSESEYSSRILEVARQHPSLKRGLHNWGQDIGINTPMSAKSWHKSVPDIPNAIDVPTIVEKHFAILKQLAKEGNLAVCYVDITDPKFLSAIKSLPMFSDITSSIYLSNAVDLSTLGALIPDKFRHIETLEVNSKAPVYVYAEDATDLSMRIARSINEPLRVAIDARSEEQRRWFRSFG